MKIIIKRMITGDSTWFEWYEEYIVPLVIVAEHQWYKLSRRSDKLLQAGNRVRGDVLL